MHAKTEYQAIVMFSRGGPKKKTQSFGEIQS